MTSDCPALRKEHEKLKRQAEKMKAAHKVLARLEFPPAPLERGYAGRTLRIDVGKKQISILPVTRQMKELWLGGKGFDLWQMLHEINKDTKWDSPENPICMSPGPLAGVMSFPGTGKTLVTSVSPLTHSIMDCNVGGHFGPFLKFVGFDMLTVTGKSKREVIILIDGPKHEVTLLAAPREMLDSHLLAEVLAEQLADDEEDRRNVAVVSAGQAANHVRMGMLNFSFWDWRRNVARLKQAGRGGVGTVFRDKKIKAIVVKRRPFTAAWSITDNRAVPAAAPLPACTGECRQAEVEKAREIASRYQCNPERVVEMLQDLQAARRGLSEPALRELCQVTGVPLGRLYHVATFYRMFSLRPRGEHVLEVCTGAACLARGAGRIVEELERQLGVRCGETTADGRFTLEEVGCLGTCALAPAVKVGSRVFGNVEASEAGKILRELGGNANG
jgi:NADH:ubiquinone oxidoreductase subunit E